jgi:potassium-transporting ATPase KdpC subunit
MIREVLKQAREAFMLLMVFSILTGLIYPAFITGIAQLFFPWKANGSIVEQERKAIGSRLIGQAFTDPKYFWGRPSATSSYPYNAASSSGSNLGPSNLKLLIAVKARSLELIRLDSQNHNLIPVDLVTASGSGLDPEISPYAAFYQVPRIAKVRGLSESEIVILIKQKIKARTFGILGEPRVNTLELNIALDNLVIARNRHGRTPP